MERRHVVIRREDYVAGSREKPEVGVFVQTHTSRPPVPWGKLAVGEQVFMKWSGGPIVASATVTGFRQFDNCTPELLRPTAAGSRLYSLDAYWRSLAPMFYGLTVYLGEERWLSEPIVPAARSRGESWIVMLDNLRSACLDCNIGKGARSL